MQASPPLVVNSTRRAIFAPVLASLVRQRRDAAILVGVGGIQVGLHLLGWPGWPCPVHQILGIPCPGCGLTTAVGLLLRGDWQEAVSTHAFAPVLVLAFGLIVLAAVLPEGLRQRLVDGLTRLEQRTGISAFLLVGLLLYWGLRLFGSV